MIINQLIFTKQKHNKNIKMNKKTEQPTPLLTPINIQILAPSTIPVQNKIQRKSLDQLQQQSKQKHQQYIASKMQRKKQLLRLMKIESSSDQEQEDEVKEKKSYRSQKSMNQDIDEDSSQEKDKEKNGSVPKGLTNKKQSEGKGREESALKVSSQKFSILSLKKGGEWVKDILQIEEDTVTILNIPYSIKNIMKLKLSSSPDPYSETPLRIKITYEKNQLIFTPTIGGPNSSRNSMPVSTQLPIPYYIFSSILQNTLIQNWPQTLNYTIPQPIFNPPPSIPPSLISNAFIYGKLMKKSQVLGKWQQRFVVINKQALLSYRKFNEKPTMEIKIGTIKQVWTRFQIVDQLFVVKIRENVMGRKVQFGLPISKCANDRCWLFFMVGLMNNRKI